MHLPNKQDICFKLLNFHLEISGNEIKDLHPLKRKEIIYIYSVFHFDISGKDSKDSHSKNSQLN